MLALIVMLDTYELIYDHLPENKRNLTTEEGMQIDKESMPSVNYLRDKGLIKTKHIKDNNYICTITPKGWKAFGREMAK